MVYRHPAKEPRVNTLPVLRLLLSDAASAQFARAGPSAVASAALSCLGASAMVRCAPWPTALAPVADRWATPVLICGTGVLLTRKLLRALRREVRAEATSHRGQCSPNIRSSTMAQPRAPMADSSPPAGAELNASSARVNSTAAEAAHRAAAPLHTKRKSINPQHHFAFTSRKDTGDGQDRSLSLSAAVRASTTLVTAWARIFRHGFCGLLGWHEPVSAVTRRRLYQVVLNTSLLSFTRTHSTFDDDLRVDVGGHVVIENIELPYYDDSESVSTTFRKIVIFVDHEAMQFRKVMCVHDQHVLLAGEPSAFTTTTTWGYRNHPDNTDDVKISAAESLHQAGLIMVALALRLQSSSSHCEEVDAFMSSQAPPTFRPAAAFDDAPFSSGLTVPVTSSSGEVVKQPLVSVLQQRSTLYQITVAATAALCSLNVTDGLDEAVNGAEVRGVIAATVQHSLEHYMLGELGPVFSDHAQCIVLKTDLSGMLHRRVYPVRHALRPSVACGNRPTDAVATVIYNACVERERELVQANAAAGEKPLFVPLKNYCADYLQS